MQARTRLILMSALACGLAACSSMQEKSGYASQGTPVASDRIDVDEAYIARVESQARQHGVEVHWVNAPTRHYSAKQ